MSGGRLFQSFAVLGKNEYICAFILERGMVYLFIKVYTCTCGIFLWETLNMFITKNNHKITKQHHCIRLHQKNAC